MFSKLCGRYSQYPDDYTRELFDKFQSMSGTGAKMVIHRDGELMYYGYVRQKTGTEYIGFCILLNGVMLTGIKRLASLFDMVYCGNGIEYFSVEWAEEVVAKIEKGVTRMKSKALPPVAYGISRDMTKVFVDEDGNKEEIVRAVAMYPYVVVEYNEGRGRLVRGDELSQDYVADERATASDVQGKNVEAKQSEEEKSGLEIVLAINFAIVMIALFGLYVSYKLNHP